MTFFSTIKACNRSEQIWGDLTVRHDLQLVHFGCLNFFTLTVVAFSDIWLTYLDLERKHPLGNPAAVGVLYERAKRTLKEPLAQTFIEQSISDS